MADRKPAILLVVDPENQDVLDWIDQRVLDALQAARAAGAPLRAINRSTMIFRALRAAKDAEAALKMAPLPSKPRPDGK